MSFAALHPPALAAPCVAFAAALVLAAVRSWRLSVWINFGAALAVCALLFADVRPFRSPEMQIALLTGFAGVVAALANRNFVAEEVAAGRLRQRPYHAAFQTIFGLMLLAQLAPAPAVATLSLEAAALAYAFACAPGGAGLRRPLARARFIPPASASLVALLGLALPVQSGVAHACLLAGYAGLAGLAPMHDWLARGRGRGPWPIALMLGVPLGNAGLLALLRLGPDAAFTAPALLALGLASVLSGALLAWRARDARRFLAGMALLHAGITATLAGLGPQATGTALLHMALSTLVLLGATAAMGHWRAWPMALLALAGVPGGIFTSEVLAATAAVRASLLVAVPLLAGIAWGAAAALRRLDLPRPASGTAAAVLPAALSLAAAFVLGVVLPLGLALPSGGAPG